MASEIWFRSDVAKDILEMRITATIRAGDRTEHTVDPKGGYAPGQIVTLKICEGENKFAEQTKEIIITNAQKMPFGVLQEKDLTITSCSPPTSERLKELFRGFYGKDFEKEDEVTMIEFEYLDKLSSAEELVKLGVLRFAQMPSENPDHLKFGFYTLPLIGHDYPAKTPIMWNKVYEQFGIEAGNVMLVGNPKTTKQIFEILRRDSKYLGGGMGVGFKDEAVPYLDELDSVAEAIGAVNFVLRTPDGRLKGFNTDGQGYAKGLKEVFARHGQALSGKKAIILGAGGSGNAIAFALAEEGMNLFIANRTIAKAEALARRLKEYLSQQGREINVSFGGEDAIEQEVQDADAVVNVSTKGAEGALKDYFPLAPANLPPTKENIANNRETASRIMAKIPKDAIISDIILGIGATPFLSEAKAAGFETLDGIPMVANQGVEAFFILHNEELQKRGISRNDVYETMRRAAGL